MKMVKSLLKDVVETAMMEKVSIQDEIELEDVTQNNTETDDEIKKKQ